MMRTRITDRDWEDLSAYLDGQLSTRDQTRLEGRLQRSADLRAALQDLRRTRAILRSQPRIRAPRNFTLTPEAAGIRLRVRPASRLSPVFGIVSALASFLLIIALLGDFVTSSPMVTSRLRSAESAAVSESKGAETMMEAPAGETVESYALEQSAPMEPVSPTLTAIIEEAPAAQAPAAETDTGVEREVQESPAGAPAYPAPGDVLTMTMMEAEVVPEATPVAAAPTAEIGLSTDLVSPEVLSDDQPAITRTFWTPFRIAEILLLGVLIIAGIAWLRLRRTGN